MAETTVTVDFIGQDDITPVIDKIKGELQALEAEGKKIAEAMGKLGIAPQAAFPMIEDPAQKRALEAYMAAQKAPPGGGGPPVFGRTDVSSFDEAKKGARGMVEEFGSLAEQFVKWSLLWKLLQDGINAAGIAIKDFGEQTLIANQAQNAFGYSIQESQAYLHEYREAAEEANMTWDEWQKFAPGAVHSLEQVGMSAHDAVAETSHLGEILDATGVDLRKLAPAVELGTASFSQLAEAGRLMGPAWAAGEAEFVKMEATEKDYQRALAQTHTLEQQRLHDIEAVTNARAGFAEKSGMATAAYEAFAKAGGRLTTTALMPTALANLPHFRDDFKKLLGDMQKDFADGARQMAKELDIPLEHVQRYIRAGVPGFDEKSLMAAHQRKVHDADTSKEREFQRTNQQRTNTLELDRLKLNEQVRDRLKEQNDFIAKQPDLFHGIQLSLGKVVDLAHDATNAVAGIGAAALKAGLGKAALPIWQSLPSLFTGLPPSVLAPITGAGTPGVVPGKKLEVHDTGNDEIKGAINDLKAMLQGR